MHITIITIIAGHPLCSKNNLLSWQLLRLLSINILAITTASIITCYLTATGVIIVTCKSISISNYTSTVIVIMSIVWIHMVILWIKLLLFIPITIAVSICIRNLVESFEQQCSFVFLLILWQLLLQDHLRLLMRCSSVRWDSRTWSWFGLGW